MLGFAAKESEKRLNHFTGQFCLLNSYGFGDL